MRWFIMLTLLFAALAAKADGFAYGKSFHMLHETDQLAVIDLDEEKADVSMFIGIAGIPEGETITYVLPFWYRPDRFEMEEMEPADYRKKYVHLAHEKVVRMNRIAADQASGNVLTAAATCGLGFVGPLIVHTLGTREKSRAGAGSQLSPYAVHRTSHASAEFYKVQAKDLQQLVAQANLPAEYAASLKKYKTSFFAVMRLTGPKQKTEREALFPLEGSGVCYRFQHALPPEKRGEYVYPLGTGAAWPRPIMFTEVYVTCPDAYVLEVTAPTEGKLTDENEFHQRLSEYEWYLAFPAERKQRLEQYQIRKNGKSKHGITEQEFLAPLTMDLLADEVKAPAAWYIAYYNSNPNEDIRIRLMPRRASWRVAVADVFTDSALSSYVSLAFALFGWVVAGLVVIRPRWRRAREPESLLQHTIVAMLVANVWITIGLVILGFIIAAASWLITSIGNPVLPGILITLAVGVMLGTMVVYTRLWMMGKSGEWRQNLAMYSWLLATAIYLALNAGLYWFVHLCEAAVL